MGIVLGQGIYEKGRYPAGTGESGKHTKEYRLWCGILKRCQVDGPHQLRNPAYLGCRVHPEFIKFQDFAEWCQHQKGFGKDGYDLDKDILIPGNKVYGPDTCCFVPHAINNLLTHTKTGSGLPTGVHYQPIGDKYKAQFRSDGVQIFLGSFPTVEQAYDAYKTAKLNEIRRVANKYRDHIDTRVYNALMAYEINT